MTLPRSLAFLGPETPTLSGQARETNRNNGRVGTEKQYGPHDAGRIVEWLGD